MPGNFSPAANQPGTSFPVPGQPGAGMPQPGMNMQQQSGGQPPQGAQPMGQGQDNEEAAFEQAFTSTAQSIIANKLPELAANITTFKVINSDLDKGSAVGAFVISDNENTLYIPVVMSDNRLKPLDIFYDKNHDLFLPLSSDWIDEVVNSKNPSIGQGVRTPQSLYTDVDIRNLVVPPTTGRYSFASADDLKLPEYLEKCSNDERDLLRNTLTENPELLKVAVEIYGYEVIKDGLTRRKEADYKGDVSTTGALYIVDNKEGPGNYKEIFGKDMPTAIRGLTMEGFYSKDGRKEVNQAIDTETPLWLNQCKTNGFYRLFKADGTTVVALVVTNPINLERNSWQYDNRPGNYHVGNRRFSDDGLEPHVDKRWRDFPPENSNKDGLHQTEYLVITEDLKCFRSTRPVIGAPATFKDIVGTQLAKAFDKSAAPTKGSDIVFIRHRGSRLEATDYVEVARVSTSSGGVRCINTTGGREIVTDPKAPIARITMPADSLVALVPPDFSVVKVKIETEPEMYIDNPKVVTNMFLDSFKGIGAHPVTIKKASDDTYFVNGNFAGDKIDTLKKLAHEEILRVDNVKELLKSADEKGRVHALVIPYQALGAVARFMKSAAEDEKKEKKKSGGQNLSHAQQAQLEAAMGGGQPAQDPSQGGDPSQGMDPSQMGMDPNQAAMMSGQPPQPDVSAMTQQAIQEIQDSVSKSMEVTMTELQSKQQSLEQELAALQAVAARMQEIQQGVPKEQSQALQALDQSASAGSLSAGAPQGQPQQMDPSAMQQAAGTGDAQSFDAAAIASLAEHSKLHDLVSAYMPTLEKSIDHLGRILLTLWIQSSELKPEIGDQAYSDIEDRLRATFKGLGELVLRIERGAFDLSGVAHATTSTS